MVDGSVALAARLMTEFAARTGLASARPARRYLWTDAFAVCNFLALRQATGLTSYEELALRLVDSVHETLGRHRGDDLRTGWLSGMSDDEGRAHPTRGGLRIGKPMPERRPDEPNDPELEWHRDGQYFHYLTKWMFALDQVARTTRRPAFLVWAIELADVAHRAFVHGPAGRKSLYWKLSVDMSRAVVPAMGQHDPLDGLVTCRELEATAAALANAAERPPLDSALADFATMIDPRALVTDDALGLGGLLVDACRLSQIADNDELVGLLLDAGATGLRWFGMRNEIGAEPHRRLAFRELGLAIGLAAAARLEGEARLDAGARRSLLEISRWARLRDEILQTWLSDEHRRAPSYADHEDINDVMLATALLPEGAFVLASPSREPPSAVAQAHA
jgi:hypothetical protein